MEWLEAGIAFAVTMMVLSTMVSGIVEMGHRVFNTREEGLKRLIEHMYRDVLVPKFDSFDVEGSAEFTDHMTKTRFLPVDANAGWWRKLIYRCVNAEQLKELDARDFVKRMGEFPGGAEFIESGRDRGREYLDAFLVDLVEKYEAFGANATDYFARRARLISGVIAIALAFALNVSAVDLFTTFLQDKGMRDRLIARGEVVAERMTAAQTSLARLQTKLDSGLDSDALQVIQEQLSALDRSASRLQSEHLPIGWSNVPWRSERWRDMAFGGVVGSVVFWFISVLLAGILIGLGGPFWFDVFKKLGALTGIVRSTQHIVESTQTQATNPTPGVGRVEDPNAQSLREVFERAAGITVSNPPRRRVLLAPDGNVESGTIA